jgi:hypothetical protein
VENVGVFEELGDLIHATLFGAVLDVETPR